MDDIDLDAVALQRPRSLLQSEQTAADHHRSTMIITGGVVDHAAGVVDGPEREDAGQQLPRISGRIRPSIGGMKDRLPVAMINSSNGVICPSSENTTLAKRSMRCTRTPACKVMPFSMYHSSEFRKMSSCDSSPEST